MQSILLISSLFLISMIHPWSNNIMISILAIWILLAPTSCRLSSDARTTTAILMSKTQEPLIVSALKYTIKNAAENHPPSPFCVYPPPTTLPPPTRTPSPPSSPYAKPDHGVWCVAKPTVPSSSMQQALDYACASGADCEPIQLNGACYQPDTLVAHASYAFNSYWQRNKKGGGTCDFGGSAMLVTVDPSYDQCHFIYSQ